MDMIIRFIPRHMYIWHVMGVDAPRKAVCIQRTEKTVTLAVEGGVKTFRPAIIPSWKGNVDEGAGSIERIHPMGKYRMCPTIYATDDALFIVDRAKREMRAILPAYERAGDVRLARMAKRDYEDLEAWGADTSLYGADEADGIFSRVLLHLRARAFPPTPEKTRAIMGIEALRELVQRGA